MDAMESLMQQQQQWVAAATAQSQMFQELHQQQILQQQHHHHQEASMHLENSNTSISGSSFEDEDSKDESMVDDLNKPDNEIIFCQVPGRLALLSANKKIKVTLAEIKRRIDPPECLNSSLLSAILRKAKNKEGGKQLAYELSRFNIAIPSGRRKAAPNTAFTALSEVEAMILAKDFGELSKNHFPFESMAYEFLKGIQSYDDRILKLYIANQLPMILVPFCNILQCDTSPHMDKPLNIPSSLHPDGQKRFTNFSLLSHGFGAAAHHSSWITLLNCIKVLIQALADPKSFCIQIGRPVPMPLASILEMEEIQHRQQQQQHFSQCVPEYPFQQPPQM